MPSPVNLPLCTTGFGRSADGSKSSMGIRTINGRTTSRVGLWHDNILHPIRNRIGAPASGTATLWNTSMTRD
jgi:hypothetical protein